MYNSWQNPKVHKQLKNTQHLNPQEGKKEVKEIIQFLDSDIKNFHYSSFYLF